MSHQRYQPRSLMMPSRALRTSPPPPTSTIVPGRVRTAPTAHPVIPRAMPSPTSHQRRRKLRANVSRSLSRCSSPEASSFQPRIREASERCSAALDGTVAAWAIGSASYTPAGPAQVATTGSAFSGVIRVVQPVSEAPMQNHRAMPRVILATFALVACTDGAGPRGAGKVRLAISTVQPSTLPSAPTGQAPSASLQAGGPETFTDASNNTLAITSVELVAGPILVDLPLGGIERMFEATVPAGTFDELRFQIHKPSDDGDAADHAFLAAHPDFAGVSIRVKGTFNGTDFTYTSDLNVEQELRFNPAVVVTAGTPAKLTVSLDLSGWFRNSGTLLDPGTTPLLPVHHREHAQHTAPCGLDRTDRFERGSTGGDHVLHDHCCGAGSETPLDPLARAVSLGLLPHGKGVDRRVAARPTTGGGDRERNRVGAQREPAHDVGPPPEGREALQREGADDREPFRCHGGTAGVDVEGRATPGGQHEVTTRNRALPQQIAQSLLEIRSRAHGSCK